MPKFCFLPLLHLPAVTRSAFYPFPYFPFLKGTYWLESRNITHVLITYFNDALKIAVTWGLLLFQLWYEAAPCPLSPPATCCFPSLVSWLGQPVFSSAPISLILGHTHARILTYLGDDPPAYCRQAYSTLSRLGPALPPNNGEANRQLGKRQEALSSSLRSVLRGALLIASLASSLLSCIKLLLLMFLFGWLFLMTTRSILWSGSRHCGWSHNLLLLSVAPCFIAILHLMLFLPWWHILSGPIWTFDLVSFMKALNKQCSDSTSLMWRERNFEELWTIFRSNKKPL